MTTWFTSLRDHLREKSIWLYFLPIFFVSLIQVKEAFLKIWPVYGLSILIGMVASLPIFWWVWNRDRGQVNRSWWAWLLCFLFLPGLIIVGIYFFQDRDISILHFGFRLLSGMILLELFHRGQQQFGHRFDWNRWFSNLKLEAIILGSIVILSLLIPFTYNPFQDELIDLPFGASILKYLFFSFKVFLLLFLFYGYYFVNHYVLIPALLQSRGLFHYGFGLALFLLICYPLTGEMIRILFANDFFDDSLKELNIFTSDGFFFVPFLVILGSLPFILAYQLLKQNHALNILKREKSETELNLLKQQINPHFFFNTLNNLYALSLTKDKHTPEVILQLSELMRYVIYKGKEERVPLEEEVQYIEDFIRLQSLRLHQNIKLSFEKKIETPGVQIPPLLFICFIENAFKHGIEPATGDCFLNIRLSVKENELTFYCENSMESRNEENPGIGLQNLKNRLAIRFPENHTLNIQEHLDRFEAELKIQGL